MTGVRLVRCTLAVAAAASLALGLAGMLGSPAPWVLVPLFIAMSTHGVNNPSLTAIALGQIRHGAGSASAVLGTLSMLLGAFVPPLVSMLGVSATIMGATMLASFVIALVLLRAPHTVKGV